jgi:hypothetical protein
MSLNTTQIVYNNAGSNCQIHYAPIQNGQHKRFCSISCIPHNATSASEAVCLTIETSKIPVNADCNFIVGGQWAKPLSK